MFIIQIYSLGTSIIKGEALFLKIYVTMKPEMVSCGKSARDVLYA